MSAARMPVEQDWPADGNLEARHLMSGVTPQSVVTVGLPRCGTTLLAAFLAAQPRCTFITDYVRSFGALRDRLGISGRKPLTKEERRAAAAMVRGELLRLRQVVVIQDDGFRTLDELHRLVVAQIAQPGDDMVGHKMICRPEQLRDFLEHEQMVCVLVYRDPRDAALSYWYRFSSSVETYLDDFERMIQFARRSRSPRLIMVRYEDLITSPEPTLQPLAQALGRSFDFSPERVSMLHVHDKHVPWQGNSSFQAVLHPFDPQALRRWERERDSIIVKYASWRCQKLIQQLGYPATDVESLAASERLHFVATSRMRRAEHWIQDRVARGRNATQNLIPPITGHAKPFRSH